MIGGEIIPALILFIGFGLAIPAAIQHDNELPVSVTGRKRK